jgi:2-(1,2-epoxy-1,2-dihydrophenyl)acetyl-CoA isomerase
MLPRVIGPFRARRLLMQVERVSAAEAAQWGLVSKVFPEAELLEAELLEAARAVAKEFASGPTVALSEMRRLLQDALRSDFDAQLEAEARALLRTFRSKDNLVGMKAFAAKTKPEFTGE